MSATSSPQLIIYSVSHIRICDNGGRERMLLVGDPPAFIHRRHSTHEEQGAAIPRLVCSQDGVMAAQ